MASGGLDLIDTFDVYLTLASILSIVARARRHLDVVRLVTAVPGRWPGLFSLVKASRAALVSWSTLAPAVLVVAIAAMQWLASGVLLPEARLETGDLAGRPAALTLLLVLGTAMIFVDVWNASRAARFDRQKVEKRLDQAEFWLKSRVSTAIRVLSLGLLDPRRKVASEVRRALEEASRAASIALWRVCLDLALSVAFGLALWITWATRFR